MIAGLEGVKSLGRGRDQAGRTGVVLALGKDVMPGPDERLIIDPGTARLLAYESGGTGAHGKPGLSMVYEVMGWVDGLDAHL
ncbi:hypothetical protein [Spirillospora sp. NPDC047279]|uniref:hypothetical protein n=1 Tax=Spirillospora sp. NPDC047279 TaxID=3155478 RepID=UPI0033E31F71